MLLSIHAAIDACLLKGSQMIAVKMAAKLVVQCWYSEIHYEPFYNIHKNHNWNVPIFLAIFLARVVLPWDHFRICYSTIYTDKMSQIARFNIGPIWGRQDPGGSHVGPMNFEALHYTLAQ